MWETVRSLLALIPLLARAQLAVWAAEWSSECHRLVTMMAWTAVMALFGALAVLMTAVTIVMAFPERRVLAASLVTALFAGVAAFAAWRIRRQRRRSDDSFSAC